MIRTVLFSSSLAALAACTHSERVTAPTGTGKPEAPVAVQAELSQSAAHLTLRAEVEGKDVSVTVSGVDGLAVQGEPSLLTATALAAGEARTFDVAFKPGPGQSHLVVSVQGTFGGAFKGRVVSFAVGAPSAAQQQVEGTVLTTDDGQRLKVMPAGH